MAQRERERREVKVKFSKVVLAEFDVRSKSTHAHTHPHPHTHTHAPTHTQPQHALSQQQQQEEEALALHRSVLAYPGPIGTERFLSVWRTFGERGWRLRMKWKNASVRGAIGNGAFEAKPSEATWGQGGGPVLSFFSFWGRGEGGGGWWLGLGSGLEALQGRAGEHLDFVDVPFSPIPL